MSRSASDRPQDSPSEQRSASVDPSGAILKERARSLAGRHLETKRREIAEETILARRGETLLAMPIDAIREVRSTEFTRVPGATRVVLGIFHIRGRTHGLVDLAPFFGDGDSLSHGDSVLIAMVHGGVGEMGLRIDEVIGPRTIYSDELDTGLGEHALGFVTHVTKDLVHLLDIDRIMATPEVRL